MFKLLAFLGGPKFRDPHDDMKQSLLLPYNGPIWLSFFIYPQHGKGFKSFTY